MKSKTRKRQEWAYLHTLEIGILNEELLERQARERRAAAAAAAAVAPAIPPGQDQLEQLAPEQLQTPPHVQEEAAQPPPTLQMFTGNYRDIAGKSSYRDLMIAGIYMMCD